MVLFALSSLLLVVAEMCVDPAKIQLVVIHIDIYVYTL